jgi:hypothetical protein
VQYDTLANHASLLTVTVNLLEPERVPSIVRKNIWMFIACNMYIQIENDKIHIGERRDHTACSFVIVPCYPNT